MENRRGRGTVLSLGKGAFIIYGQGGVGGFYFFAETKQMTPPLFRGTKYATPPLFRRTKYATPPLFRGTKYVTPHVLRILRTLKL